ncbi:MAG TPA: hypothetical protein VFA07_14405 [Chthonomonadaceae bacterium]|nr:hypothetical protein [Chthonomonadaceae bacterium]
MKQQAGWQASLEDPFRAELLAVGDALPERVRECAEPLRGEPAFDLEEIARIAQAIRLPAEVRFEHPFLERSVRVRLAHIEATFQSDHPKYGVGAYAEACHDGFPPTIIAAVDALTLWDMPVRAERLFAYWLANFVREDGTLRYYGPSLSEYGQLLTTARRLMERGGTPEWFRQNRSTLARIAAYLQDGMRRNGSIALLSGAPEADTCHETATYFHNNAWIVRGLDDWADLIANHPESWQQAHQIHEEASILRRLLLEAIEATWPHTPQEWWLRPTLEPEAALGLEPPRTQVTETHLGSYTNYRYWPELLSSGVLPRALMERVVSARLQFGGQFCGMTRFADHLDDWPLMEWLEALWQLDRHADYRLSLWGHLAYHQAEGHLTAYEQVTFPPGRKVADYCLPCQLVAARALRRLV